jgi:hypothetical protein
MDIDILALAEEFQRISSALSADAAVLDTSEGGRQIPHHPGVHPHNARIKVLGESVCPLQVGSP